MALRQVHRLQWGLISWAAIPGDESIDDFKCKAEAHSHGKESDILFDDGASATARNEYADDIRAFNVDIMEGWDVGDLVFRIIAKFAVHAKFDLKGEGSSGSVDVFTTVSDPFGESNSAKFHEDRKNQSEEFTDTLTLAWPSALVRIFFEETGVDFGLRLFVEANANGENADAIVDASQTVTLLSIDFLDADGNPVPGIEVVGSSGFHYPVNVTNVLSSLPRLSITLPSATSALLSWPTNSTGFVLQQNSAPATPAWEDLLTPATTVGDHFQVTVSPSSTQQFFRLRKTP